MSLFNTKDEMFRALDAWSSKTFGEAFSEIVLTDKNREIVDLLATVVNRQALTKKKMNGYCSEGLRLAEFEKMRICYVDVFNKLEASERFWTPIDILYEVCEHNLNDREFYEEKAREYKTTFEDVTIFMCGRAIRALPSYIREYQLRNALKLTFPTARFYQDEQMDKKFHCDIKMNLDNQTYFFWSFISSTRSISQFMDKFKNHRYGNILDGIHVLCPFDRFNECFATYKGWCFYSDKYIREIKNSILFKPHVNYKTVINSKAIDVKEFRNPIVVDKNIISFSCAV